MQDTNIEKHWQAINKRNSTFMAFYVLSKTVKTKGRKSRKQKREQHRRLRALRMGKPMYSIDWGYEAHPDYAARVQGKPYKKPKGGENV